MTDSGSSISFNIFSPKKTTFSNVLIIFGIVIFSSDEHSENTLLQIYLTVIGIIIFVSNEHFKNAFLPIFSIDFGIITVLTLL